jgi:hypothetical protein
MFTGSNCKQKTNPSTTVSNTNVTTTYFITITTTALPNNYTNTVRFVKIILKLFFLKYNYL